MEKNILVGLLCIFLVSSSALSQDVDEDAFFIKKIHNTALGQGRAYDWLKDLTDLGPRPTGKPQTAAALAYVKQVLDTLGVDSVWLQPCMVPHWERGDKEQVRIVNSNKIGSLDLRALALGNSVGTGDKGLTAVVVQVRSLDEAEKLGKAGKLKGKIVFYNRPFDNSQIRTFTAYGGAVDQRVYGPAKAAKYGAVAALVRSMTGKLDEVPHTGVTVYEEDGRAIPAAAISTLDADMLARLLEEEEVRVFMRMTCKTYSMKPSFNVVAEIKGSEKPDEILLVGGHLDSWDVGTGAHDDGAGCVQSMDVIQIFKRLGYRPKRTLRCVLFMAEENSGSGARAYAAASDEKGERHIAAIESDAGGFSPRGFTCEADPSVFVEKFSKAAAWSPLLEPYQLFVTKGGSGADISKLKHQKPLLIGLSPDSQRYFDYHHTAIDTFDKVNQRELALGAAAMASLIYLMDKYGM